MATQDPTTLNEREKEALRLLLVGHDAKSIANTLGLSVYTINDRLRDARRKLEVSSSRKTARRLAEIDGAKPNLVGAKEIGKAQAIFAMEGANGPAATQSAVNRCAWLTGGMLIMSLIIAAVALSTMVGSRNDAQVPAQSATSAAARSAETDASATARSWAGLLDSKQWDGSWRAAGSMFKSQLTSAQWATTIQSVRQPLGRVSSRTLQSAVQTKTLPGAPTGDYQVLQFQTRFATKPDAVETIVLAREKGSWRVSGYYIR